MKIQYENELIQNLGMGDPTTCVYQVIYHKNESDDKKIIPYLLYMDWDYVLR